MNSERNTQEEPEYVDWIGDVKEELESEDIAIRKAKGEKARNEAGAAILSSIEKSNQEQIEANNKRISLIMEDLWGAGGRIRLYEEAFNNDQKMAELLPEIENHIKALSDSVDSEIEFDGKDVFETLNNLTKKRDHIKLVLLRK